MQKTFKSIFFLFLVIYFIIAIKQESFSYQRQVVRSRSSEAKDDYGDIAVTEVIKADTLILENGQRVKLIGVDPPGDFYSPHLKEYMRLTGKDSKTLMDITKEAAAFTKSLTMNKRVRLEFDEQRQSANAGLLVYLYLPDGKMLNAELIKKGYSYVYKIGPNIKYSELLTQAMDEAKEDKLGIWK